MPRIFTEAGWSTCAIGKNHFAPPRNTHGYQKVILGEPSIRDLPEVCDYRTWFDSKAPGHHPFEGFRSGNDQRGGICYPLDEELHVTRWTADQAVQFLKGDKDGKPWFLKVSFLCPHTPLNAPKRWYDRYEGVDIPPAAIGDWARREYGGSKPPSPNTPRLRAVSCPRTNCAPPAAPTRPPSRMWTSRLAACWPRWRSGANWKTP